MAYVYDDYDFDYCKLCKKLHMVHLFKLGICQGCVSKYPKAVARLGKSNEKK